MSNCEPEHGAERPVGRASWSRQTILSRYGPLAPQEVRALVACHTEFPLGKFIGKCNTAKAELDTCFRVRRS